MEELNDARVLSLLGALEDALDPANEDELERQWLGFWFAHDDDAVCFRPSRPQHTLREVPKVFVNDTLPDSAEGRVHMLLQQYGGALAALGGDTLPMVRANYGVGILSCPFGTPLFRMEREQNTLPNVRPLGEEGLRTVLRGVPSLDDPMSRQVFAMGELYAEIGVRWPKIGRYVHVYHPDLQGPCDVLELIMGSEMFYTMADEPEIVCEALEVLTETYRAYMGRWLGLHPYNGRYSFHWGFMQRGAVCVREDSAMNLSPEMYRQFVAPYDGALIEQYGGIVHFCGRGEHFIEQLAAFPNLYGVQLGQPEMNGMEEVTRLTAAKGIALLSHAGEVPAGSRGWVHAI